MILFLKTNDLAFAGTKMLTLLTVTSFELNPILAYYFESKDNLKTELSCHTQVQLIISAHMISISDDQLGQQSGI